MKIAIIGTGGVGGYYGGLLAEQGQDVTFIARGAHLKAIRENGLRVMSIHGDFHVNPAQATEDPASIGEVDLVLFCTKTFSTESAAKAMRPLVGAKTTILPLQNGVDTADKLAEIFDAKHIIGGATWISSAIESPGVIKQVSQFRRIVLGEFDGKLSARVQSIFKALKSTGIDVETTNNIQKILWSKFIFISAASSLGSLTRLSIGEYRAVPETRAMIAGLMQEVEAVARAEGVNLDEDVVKQSLAFMDGAAAHIRASMQLDVEAGRRSELESMVGSIGRRGRQVNVLTPIADFIYATLLPIELKVGA